MDVASVGSTFWAIVSTSIWGSGMKAEEAKTKVCPFIQMPQESFDIYGGQRVQNITCICGSCMAWVYTKTDWHKQTLGEKKDYNVDANEGYCARIGQ